MFKNILLLVSLVLILLSMLFCSNPDTLVDKADGTITGDVAPGEAAGRTGRVIIVVSFTNEMDNIDWQQNRDVLGQFGVYEIDELPGGKYYIAAHIDENRNDQRDSGEYWGGYDSNGDGRLDPVTLEGGKTLRKDISFFAKF
jgi:hypothetical protein